MLTERRWYAIPSQLFTASGTADGRVTLPTTKPFKVKQKVRINATGQDQLILEVKRVSSPTELYVGPCQGSIDKRTDISAYTTGALATIVTDEQNRSNVPEQEIPRAVFEEEPTLAIRSKLVDWLGRCYSIDNPFPVTLSDGNISIGTVNAEVEVQLSHLDNYPDIGDVHDSVRVGDGTELLAINPDGSINVVASLTGSTAALPVLAEVALPISNTEYSYFLPAGTKRFYLKARSGSPKLKIAFTSGQVASTSGSFSTVHPGGSFDREAVSFPAGKTVYISSSKSSEILEVEYWT